MGQTVDSVIFYTIAFYGIVPDLFILVVTTLGVKAVIAVADTPAIYFVRYLARLHSAVLEESESGAPGTVVSRESVASL